MRETKKKCFGKRDYIVVYFINFNLQNGKDRIEYKCKETIMRSFIQTKEVFEYGNFEYYKELCHHREG